MVTETMEYEIDLDSWLISTQERRDELTAFSKSRLPTDAGERHTEMEKTINWTQDASDLLADAENFMTQAQGIAVMTVRVKYPDLSADERKIMAKDAVRTIQRLVDGIATTTRALHDRLYVMQNQNRSRL